VSDPSRVSPYAWLAGVIIGLAAAAIDGSGLDRLSVYICLAGGVAGGMASAIAWLTLGAFLWMPYRQQLRDHGIMVDDNGWAMGLFFVPPAIGIAFFISSLIGLIAAQWTGHPRLILVVAGLAPGLLLTIDGLIVFARNRYWYNPGFEAACSLIGLGWGTALYAITSQGALIEG
jgi:hypothetical protein